MGLFTTSYSYTVILLQIVMVSPGTHLVNKSWVPVQKQWVPVKETTNPQLEMLGPLCAQTNKRDSVVKHNEHSKKCAFLNKSHKNGHRNHRNNIFYKNIFRSIDQSIFVSYGTHAMNFCVFGAFVHQGRRMQRQKNHWLQYVPPPCIHPLGTILWNIEFLNHSFKGGSCLSLSLKFPKQSSWKFWHVLGNLSEKSWKRFKHWI